MIHGKYFNSTQDNSEIFALRRQVFCEEQGFSANFERDENDNMAYYALVYDLDEKPAATGRLYIDSESHFRIGRICTRPDMRKQGMGDLVIRMLLDLAIRLNAPYVLVASQLPAMSFYARYGFKETGRDMPEEGVMHKEMRINTEDIELDGCKHCKNQQ